MKIQNVKWVSAVFLAGTIALVPGYAGVDSRVESVRKSLEKVPVAEMAAKSARLVSSAKAADKATVALAAVDVIVKKNPTVASSVVYAISSVAPELAADVAARAAQMSPTQAKQVARAAMLAVQKVSPEAAPAIERQARSGSPGSITPIQVPKTDPSSSVGGSEQPGADYARP